MVEVLVKIKMNNDYNNGSKNGTIKELKCYTKSKKDKNGVIKYLEEVYEINMDDIWELVSIT